MGLINEAMFTSSDGLKVGWGRMGCSGVRGCLDGWGGCLGGVSGWGGRVLWNKLQGGSRGKVYLVGWVMTKSPSWEGKLRRPPPTTIISHSPSPEHHVGVTANQVINGRIQILNPNNTQQNCECQNSDHKPTSPPPPSLPQFPPPEHYVWHAVSKIINGEFIPWLQIIPQSPWPECHLTFS